MILNISLITAYILAVIKMTHGYVREQNRRKERQLSELKDQLRELEERKEDSYKEKLSLEAEAVNIFALYEIAKDITKALNEKQAFETFRSKLAQHVKFCDCQMIGLNDEKVSTLTRDPDYFMYLMKSKIRKIGYLAIKGVGEDEKEIVVILATQFVLALRRVELYQEIERVAITDSLTEVHTRRYLLDRLNEEIDRSAANKLDLAVLMIDVDHFKKFNDTYGHLTGDQVLREIGRIIKENLREIDVAGRYGGEEFCVVLPDTDSAGAAFAAERIRQATAATAIKAYDTTISATLSLGVSQFPKDGKAAAELLDKADWALYRAKKQGRNRVCSFGIYKE